MKVKRRRLELPRRNWHYPLKVARLPIPPPLHHEITDDKKESAQNRTRTCTPRGTRTWNVRVYQFRHLGILIIKAQCPNALFCSTCWAENGTRTRDPNLGKVVLYQLSYFRIRFLFRGASLSIADAKVLLFSELPKLFGTFFTKNFSFSHFPPFRPTLHLIIYRLQIRVKRSVNDKLSLFVAQRHTCRHLNARRHRYEIKL